MSDAESRQSRHPVVAGTMGIRTAMTSQMTSEWTLTASPSSRVNSLIQLWKNQMARAALA